MIFIHIHSQGLSTFQMIKQVKIRGLNTFLLIFTLTYITQRTEHLVSVSCCIKAGNALGTRNSQDI